MWRGIKNERKCAKPSAVLFPFTGEQLSVTSTNSHVSEQNAKRANTIFIWQFLSSKIGELEYNLSFNNAGMAFCSL